VGLLTTVLLERQAESESIFYMYVALGYALLFAGAGDDIEKYENFMKEAGIIDLVRGLAYLGTGRADMIEELVHNYLAYDLKGVNVEAQEINSNNIKKGIVLLGISLISLNDSSSRNIAKRLLINQLVKDKTGAVPLALTLLYTSEPDVEVIDALSRSINQQNPIHAILGLGIVGAGTNNTRIANLLEQQYTYYSSKTKISNLLKIAQGLVCLGKGTLTLSPLMFDKSHINVKSISGLLGVCMLFLGDTTPMLDKYSFLFTLLASSISNKFVVTMDKELNFKETEIRIGRPVLTNSMPGKRKNLSAVVVHESPVIIQCDERADIYEDDWKYLGYCEDVLIVDVNDKK